MSLASPSNHGVLSLRFHMPKECGGDCQKVHRPNFGHYQQMWWREARFRKEKHVKAPKCRLHTSGMGAGPGASSPLASATLLLVARRLPFRFPFRSALGGPSVETCKGKKERGAGWVLRVGRLELRGPGGVEERAGLMVKLGTKIRTPWHLTPQIV